VVEETILAHHPTGETMNLRPILHHPGRLAAAAVTVGLFFWAGSATAGSDGADAVSGKNQTDAPVASLADGGTLAEYLDTLTPADRAQTIVALIPNVRGALAAIVASNVATSNTH
jgi:hypothetical protein